MSGVDKLSAAEAAWLAGFLDGEGHLAITPSRGGTYLQPHLAVNNTHRGSIEHVADLAGRFGGPLSVGRAKRYRPHHSVLWYVNITDRERLYAMGQRIAPYSITKVDQWRLLMDFCESRMYRGIVALDAYTETERSIAISLAALTRRPAPHVIQGEVAA